MEGCEEFKAFVQVAPGLVKELKTVREETLGILRECKRLHAKKSSLDAKIHEFFQLSVEFDIIEREVAANRGRELCSALVILGEKRREEIIERAEKIGRIDALREESRRIEMLIGEFNDKISRVYKGLVNTLGVKYSDCLRLPQGAPAYEFAAWLDKAICAVEVLLSLFLRHYCMAQGNAGRHRKLNLSFVSLS